MSKITSEIPIVPIEEFFPEELDTGPFLRAQAERIKNNRALLEISRPAGRHALSAVMASPNGVILEKNNPRPFDV
jgi:hypothetical protein